MNFPWNKFLDGTREGRRKVISEKTIDDIINILCLDPDKIMNSQERQTLKETFWDELAVIILVWGRPSDTFLGISPKKVLKHVKDKEKIIVKALETIEEFEHNTESLAWVKSKEIITAKRIQEKADDHDLFLEGLNATKEHLQKLTAYIGEVANDLEASVGKRGISKTSKEMHDRLIYELCKVYKRYTGREPISWNTGTSSINFNQFTNEEVLLFLQGILSNTYYSGEDSLVALQKKIIRMRKNKKYAELWQDTKK